jgi:hypothetical protein
MVMQFAGDACALSDARFQTEVELRRNLPEAKAV